MQLVPWGILPEAVLVVGSFFVFFMRSSKQVFQQNRETSEFLAYFLTLSTVFLAVVFAFFGMLVLSSEHETGTWNWFSFLTNTPLSQFFKVLILVAGFFSILLTRISKDSVFNERLESHGLQILGLFSACLIISSQNFILTFIGFEVLAFIAVVLVSFQTNTTRSSEATFKLMLHSMLGTFFFIVGMFFVYKVNGSFDLRVLHETFVKGIGGNEKWSSAYYGASFLFLIAGILSRLCVFPFQFAPVDFLDGAPVCITAFLSTVMPITAIAVFFQIVFGVFGQKDAAVWKFIHNLQWTDILIFISSMTMALGVFFSLSDSRFKRLLIFFGISQIGFALLGLSTGTARGLSGMLYALISFVFASLGMYFVVQNIQRQGTKYEDKRMFDGLIWKNPWLGVAACCFLFSLVGLPPFVGFFSQIYILGATLELKWYWISIFVLFIWIIGAGFSVQLIRRMFISDAEFKNNPSSLNMTERIALFLLLIPVFSLGIFGDFFARYIQRFF